MKAIYNYIRNICHIWYKELRYILLDGGMILFLSVLPIAYPIIYSWIYNNEVVRDVPVVVVDNSHSSLSREYIRLYDASPNVKVAYYANNLQEAKDIIGHQKAYGVLVFPEDFATKVNRMEQATVSLYCDMTMMLAYKNIFQTATTVNFELGDKIKVKLLGNHTDREDEIATNPLAYDEVPIFNTTGGYGNFVLPAVLILLLQQTLLLGIGMTSGTLKEKTGRIILDQYGYMRIGPIIFGRYLAYMMQYIVIGAYVLLLIPKVFGFVNIIYFKDFLMFLLPYISASFFFAMTAMSVIRQREDVLLIVVFTSIIFMFLTGLSWPTSSIPDFWRYVGYLIPSTFGVKGFVAMSSMGARIEDIKPELTGLYIQALVYAITTVIIYHRNHIKTTDDK